jgi:hypothetical protein
VTSAMTREDTRQAHGKQNSRRIGTLRGEAS